MNAVSHAGSFAPGPSRGPAHELARFARFVGPGLLVRNPSTRMRHSE